MLTIMLAATDDHEEFKLVLEHSLASISKWEAIHEKAFFSKDGMTSAETLSYIRQMVIGEIPPEGWVNRLEIPDFETITQYINSKQTATWFRDTGQPPPRSSETVTSELIYYWMIQFQIPFHPAETWHLNRLMTLIKICGIKQTKPKKMSKQAQAEEYRRLNAQRLEQLGTTG